MKKGLIEPDGLLIGSLRANGDESDAAIMRSQWPSLVCKSCGVCCHSSLVPVAQSDCDALYDRLPLGISKEAFAKIFLQKGGDNRPVQTLETVAYGGCCMFLERKDYFSCAVWHDRLDVCHDFFCAPMVAFRACEAGDEQDLFDPSSPWEERLSLLFEKVADEVIGSLFPSDQIAYFKSREPMDRPSYFSSHPTLFGILP